MHAQPVMSDSQMHDMHTLRTESTDLFLHEAVFDRGYAVFDIDRKTAPARYLSKAERRATQTVGELTVNACVSGTFASEQQYHLLRHTDAIDTP